MLVIDGAQGEGGGQVLRSSLALAMVTGRAFKIERIRAGRAKPGLMRQHLTAVTAAAKVGAAKLGGAALGSTELWFDPAGVRAGEYAFSTGSAGSATLVLQTVLPALARAGGPSKLVLEGGTHNPMAPPFEFLERVYLPLLARTGPRVAARLVSAGFYPAGGGRLEVEVEPGPCPGPLILEDPGELRAVRVEALVAALPRSVGEREVATVGARLGIPEAGRKVRELARPRGPGNALLVEVEYAQARELFAAFGAKGVRAEEVAAGVANEVEPFLKARVPVGEHLADQLVLALALGRGGRFRTTAPSGHLRTQVEVIRSFLGTAIGLHEEGGGAWRVEVPEPRDRA